MLKILNWYIARNFIFTFLMAMGVLTFGMTGARLIKVFEYISQGVSAVTACSFILYVMPVVLAFTIPWAALVSIMLVFGRLSADNEITAMRACGVSILQIVAPIIALCFMLTGICLYLQMEIGPRYLGKANVAIKSVVVDNPLSLFTPGIYIELKDIRMIFDSKDRKSGTLRGIQITRFRDRSRTMSEDISASTAKITSDRTSQVLYINLEDVSMIVYENNKDTMPRRTFMKQLSIPYHYGEEFNSNEISLRDKHEGYRQLYARSVIEREKGDRQRICEIETELNQRIALALAPMAFLLLGLPLAIRTSRRETSVGLFLSVLLAGLYYGAVLVSDTLQSAPNLYPQYLVWLPPAFYQIFGAFYIFKIARC